MTRQTITQLFAASFLATALLAVVGLAVTVFASFDTSPAATALAAFRWPATLAAALYFTVTAAVQFVLGKILKGGHLPRQATLAGALAQAVVAAVGWSCLLRGAPSRALFVGMDLIVSALVTVSTLILVVNWLALFAAELPAYRRDPARSLRDRHLPHGLQYLSCALILIAWGVLETRPLPSYENAGPPGFVPPVTAVPNPNSPATRQPAAADHPPVSRAAQVEPPVVPGNPLLTPRADVDSS